MIPLAVYAAVNASWLVPAAITWTAATTLAISVPLIGGEIVSYTKGDDDTGDALGNANQAVFGVGETAIGGAMSLNQLFAPAISSSIANGPAFQKRIIQEGNFKGLIENKKQFAHYIKKVIEDPTAMEKLEGGKIKYWDAKNKGIVIYDPKNPDQGKAFQAKNGKKIYDKIK